MCGKIIFRVFYRNQKRLHVQNKHLHKQPLTLSRNPGLNRGPTHYECVALPTELIRLSINAATPPRNRVRHELSSLLSNVAIISALPKICKYFFVMFYDVRFAFCNDLRGHGSAKPCHTSGSPRRLPAAQEASFADSRFVSDFSKFSENLLRRHRPAVHPDAAGVMDCNPDGRS